MKMKLLMSLRWIPFAVPSVILTLSFWAKTALLKDFVPGAIAGDEKLFGI